MCDERHGLDLSGLDDAKRRIDETFTTMRSALQALSNIMSRSTDVSLLDLIHLETAAVASYVAASAEFVAAAGGLDPVMTALGEAYTKLSQAAHQAAVHREARIEDPPPRLVH